MAAIGFSYNIIDVSGGEVETNDAGPSMVSSTQQNPSGTFQCDYNALSLPIVKQYGAIKKTRRAYGMWCVLCQLKQP